MKHLNFLLIFCLLFAASNLFAQKTPKNSVKQCDALLARQLIEQQADFSKTLGETDGGRIEHRKNHRKCQADKS